MNPDTQTLERDRKTQIADAALTLLGREGARALTHRRVDQEAGLPESSTSYYCQRRSDLLALVLERYAELERLDLLKYASLFDQPMEQDVLAQTVAGQIVRWLKAQSRALLAARFELFLAASREPELTSVVRRNRTTFQATIERALKTAGTASPRLTAKALMAFMEGFLLDALRADAPIMKPAEVERVVRSIIRQS